MLTFVEEIEIYYHLKYIIEIVGSFNEIILY